jgi:hypothetical protein
VTKQKKACSAQSLLPLGFRIAHEFATDGYIEDLLTKFIKAYTEHYISSEELPTNDF